MPAQTYVRRVARPFTGGLRDEPSDPRHASELENALYPLGICVRRGGWGGYGRPNNGGHDVYACFEEKMPFSGYDGPDLLYSSDDSPTGGINLGTSASREGVLRQSSFIGVSPSPAPTYHYMRGLFNGYAVIAEQTGEVPLIMWAGCAPLSGGISTGDLTGSSGVSGTVVTSSAGIFNAEHVGRFVGAYESLDLRRIVAVISSSTAIVHEPFQASSTDGFLIYDFAPLGLMTEVTRVGTATKNGTGATVTGTNTRWASQPEGYGRPAYWLGEAQGWDVIAPIGIDYGEVLGIDSVASNTSLDVYASSSTTWGASALEYRIYRPLVGKVAVVHKTRLYTAGCAWKKRRLYITPALYNGHAQDNGEFSTTVDIGRALECANVDIPGPDYAGEITGLLSLPSGNLGILCSDAIYIGWGEYPAFATEKIADYGNFDGRSCVAVDEGAWFAGREGVFEIRGNRCVNIIEDHLGATWRALERQGFVSILLSVINDHLLVYVTTLTGSPTTLVYDRRSQTWPGRWTLPGDVTYFFPSRVAGEKDRLLMCHGDDQPGELSTTIVDQDTTMTVTTNAGDFKAVTPDDVAGDLSAEREVKYAKVSYQLDKSGTETLDIRCDLQDGTTPDVAAQVGGSAGANGKIAMEYVEPHFDITAPENRGLGQRTRTWKLDLRHEADAPTLVSRLAIHELEMEVKEYRRRG